MTRQKRTLRISSRSKFLLYLGTSIAITCLLYYGSPLFWLGYSTLSVLSGATRVQTFEVDPRSQPVQGPLNTQVGNKPILKVGRELGGADADALKRVLLAPQYYQITPFMGEFGACHLSPGVGFRFWRGQECVDILACYECYHIIAVTPDAQGKTTHTFITPFPVNELSGFVRKGFPNEPLLQKSIQDYESHRMESE